jgi:hypothetical protein
MFPTIDTLFGTGALIPLLGCLAICLMVTAHWKLAGKQTWPRVIGDFLALASLSGIVAVTLFRTGMRPSFSPSGALDWAGDGIGRFVDELGSDSEITLNALLFVPAGAVLTFRLRRPIPVLSFLALLSLAIELVQGLLELGNPDVTDLLSNTLGAFAGASFATVALCLTKHRNASLVWTAAGAIGLAVLATAAAVPLAKIRQGDVEHELTDAFRGTTLVDYRRWEDTGELPDRVFSVDRRFSDGATSGPDSAVVRFPASTLGVLQCVYATWTAHGFEIRPESGGRCTTFMG